MKTLEDKITESGCEALKGMIKALQDNGFEVTVKNTEPIYDLLPEFTLSKVVFDYLSNLTEWKEIPFDSAVYDAVLFKTQDLTPIDYGNSLHCHYADYDLNDSIYRLTWTIGVGLTEKPIIEIKSNNVW